MESDRFIDRGVRIGRFIRNASDPLKAIATEVEG